jgi:hypothetical protein
MTEQTENDVVVLVELGGGQIRQISREGKTDPKALAEMSGKSKDAVEKSLDTIGWVAEKTRAMIESLHEKPATVEVEFGIKITAEAGVIVAKGQSEFHIVAKLVWENKEPAEKK